MEKNIFLIAAVDRQGVIGANNAIPWRLSTDMRFFRQMTSGKPVIMGRKTYESIGRPLPKRLNIVLTRQSGYQPEGVVVVHTLEEALEAAGEAPEIAIIGGAEIYRLFLPLARHLYLTHVEAQVRGDTIFPEFEPSQWETEEVARHEADEKNEFGFQIVKYERKIASCQK